MPHQSHSSITPAARLTDLMAVVVTTGMLTIPFALVPRERFPEAAFLVALAIAAVFAGFSAVRLRALHLVIERLWRDCRRANATLRSIGEGVITTDRIGRLEYLNPRAEALLGLSAEAVRGKTINSVLQDAVPARAGHSYPAAPLVEPMVTSLRDSGGCRIGSLVVLRDVTRMRSIVGQLDWRTTHDALTGLVNRAEFERRASRALLRASDSGEPSCLCLISLDQFKVINHLGGYRAGDQVLRQVAMWLTAAARPSDSVARWGGDEFALLLEGCSPERRERICHDLLETAATWRLAWEDRVFRIGVSIGVTAIDGDTPDLAALLSAADTACRTAKENGRMRVEHYEPGNRELIDRHAETDWVDRIVTAIDRDRYCLYFQRYADLRGDARRVHGEVLVRMIGDNGDLIPPGAFLPTAERYHLMPQLDRWVIRTAFARFAEFGDETAELWSINLSGQSLFPEMYEFIECEAKAHGVSHRAFCFEITETSIIRDVPMAVRLVEQLRSSGFLVALDDFGSGFASFSYLKTIPLDFVKIDGLFIRNIRDNPVDYAVVEAVRDVAKVMNLRTIGEFVEDDGTLALLRDIGLDFAQGHAVAKPLPLAAIRANPGEGE